LANALYGVCAYIGKTLLPAGLAIMYPYEQIGTVALVWALIAVAITALTWRFRWSRPYLLAGWGWYVLALAPVSGVVQTGMQSIADRFTYLPSIGLFIATVWLVADLRAISRPVAAAAAALAIVIWSIVSFRYVGLWKDSQTLFSHAVEVVPNNVFAHMMLGNVLLAQNQYDQATVELTEAVRESNGAAMPLGELGAALVRQKRFAEAVDPLQRSIAADPKVATVHLNLANALSKTGRAAEAFPHLDEVEKLDPSLATDVLASRAAAKL